MQYPPEQLVELERTLPLVLTDMDRLMRLHIHVGSSCTGAVQEHLVHGACRRLAVLLESTRNIFSLFPPEREAKLSDAALVNVQINLQAFCINVAGILDNWAWAFVLRHSLLESVGGKFGADLFGNRLRPFLPRSVAVQVDEMRQWKDEYLKGYRDSLAHRIPLYIPPYTLTDEETARYRQLERERDALLFSDDHVGYEAVCDEIDSIGRACPVFLHSYEFDDHYRPVVLHAQVLTDGMTVVKCGNVFLDNWQRSERATPAGH